MTGRLLRILTAVVLLGGAAAAGVHLLASPSAYTVRVYLLSADRLVPGNNVDMNGVPAGRVTSVQLAPDSGTAGAIVTIELNHGYAPLHQGTRAVIRPDGVIGDLFLELDAVRSGPLIPSGGSIPLEDTQVSVTLDQVTNILDANTRQELGTLIRQGGAALNSRGPDLNRVLARLPRISADLAGTTGSLDQQTQQLSELDAEFSQVAAMVSGEHQALSGDVSNGAAILGTLAQHQASLQAELRNANSSLSTVNTALNGRQQDVRSLLTQLPQLLQALQALESSATTSAGIVNPCMQDLLTTLSELASADNYRQAAGATDGAGYMLRINPQVAITSNGSFSPRAACSGGGG